VSTDRRAGMTLLELLVVLMVLSLILTAAVKAWDVTLERGRYETTRKRLDQIATAITGDPGYVVAGRRADFGFIGDMGRLPENLAELAIAPPVSPPESSRWRGPYMRAPFNEAPTAFLFDGWGDSILYSKDSLFIRSYGGRGLADRTRWMTHSLGFERQALLLNSVQGRVVDVRGVTPPANDTILGAIKVTLEYPFEGRNYATSLTGLELTSGQFNFASIPQGSHTLRGKYIHFAPPRDSVMTTMNVTVYPGFGAQDVRLQLNVDWNSEP